MFLSLLHLLFFLPLVLLTSLANIVFGALVLLLAKSHANLLNSLTFSSFMLLVFTFFYFVPFQAVASVVVTDELDF